MRDNIFYNIIFVVKKAKAMGFKKLKAKKYNGIYEYFGSDGFFKCYYISYRRVDGAVRKYKTDANTKEEALKQLQEAKATVEKEKKLYKKDEQKIQARVISEKLTLDDVAKLYFPTKENAEAKKDERKYYNHISKVLGHIKISKLNDEDIKNLRVKVQKKKTKQGRLLNPRTVIDIIENLRTVLNYAKFKKYISDHPLNLKDLTPHELEVRKKIVFGTEVLKNKNNEVGRVLTEDELHKLWGLDELIANEKLYIFLKACYITGARPDGIMYIQVKHIDFEKKKIHIRAMKHGTSYYANANNELLNLLSEWIKKHNLVHNNYIFYPIQTYIRAKTEQERKKAKNSHSQYPNYAKASRKIFDKYFNQNIDTHDFAYRASVYTLRRTSATRVYEKYGLIRAKNFLHHTEVTTTMKYLNVQDDLGEEELEF